MQSFQLEMELFGFRVSFMTLRSRLHKMTQKFIHVEFFCKVKTRQEEQNIHLETEIELEKKGIYLKTDHFL